MRHRPSTGPITGTIGQHAGEQGIGQPAEKLPEIQLACTTACESAAMSQMEATKAIKPITAETTRIITPRARNT